MIPVIDVYVYMRTKSEEMCFEENIIKDLGLQLNQFLNQSSSNYTHFGFMSPWR